LSNVAIRSDGATKSDPPVVVTRVTKSMTAVFDALSFQDGNGSRGAGAAGAQPTASAASTPATNDLIAAA
jgi:hypothetical protein